MKYPISDQISDFLDIRIRFSVFPIQTEPYPTFYYPTISVFDFLISAHLLYILYILFNWTNHSINLSLFTPLNFRACAWQKNSGKVLQNLSYYIYTKTQNYNFIFILCYFIFPLMNDLVWPGYSLKGKNEVAQNENKNCDFGFLCI